MERFIGQYKFSIDNRRNYDNLIVFAVVITLLGVIFALGMGNVSAAPGDTIYVNNATGNDDYDGISATWVGGMVGPKATIQNGTNTVDDNGRVNVADGTYNEHITINKNVTLLGQSQIGTIIDGTASGRPLIITPGLTVNLTNFTIQNGNADSGGGIYNEGTVIINNCTIRQNIAQAYYNAMGGAIFNLGTITLNDCTITQNTANSFSYSGSGGAIINAGSVTINSCIITQNTAQGGSSSGGAIFNNGNVLAHYNVFNGNTALTGAAISNYYGYVDAQYNWWGSNVDPSSQFYGVLYNPWLYMTIKATPNNINNGETSQIIASFNNLFDGTTVTDLIPTIGHIPDGILVNFSSDALGTVNPLSGTTINGIASTTFTAGLNPGISTITSSVDAATVTTGVTINENVPPLVTSTSPVNNALNVVVNKVIQITFDRNIQLGTNPWIELKTSSSGTAVPYTTNIVGNVLSITPNSLLAVGTSYSVILHSNSVINLVGIGLAAPYTTRFTTETPPVVTSTSPVNNAFNVALNKVIQITFDKAIQLGTNPWIELKTSNSGTIVPYTTNIIGNVLSITPNSLLNAGTKYTVILHSNSITDMQGNGLNTPYTTIFTTTLPPVVTSTSPMNNEVNVAVNKVIQINFSKAIQLGTNSWIELKNQYGQIKPYTTSINGNTLNITANAAFARGTTYTVILHSNSVTSTGGAGLTTPYTTKFTTTTT
ncbi:Ig-like domain-containing protein [Methanobacterium spitsbergense]|uniref:Ig-like domain-containing protein n=1 Tax=Methanobacterium spitsbergense TaxID=2874285 RepID=A0A8T5UMZ4_9EURY|nr:Ig-like domain-containing protein [Methanobacterium spitsbergense]